MVSLDAMEDEIWVRDIDVYPWRLHFMDRLEKLWLSHSLIQSAGNPN